MDKDLRTHKSANRPPAQPGAATVWQMLAIILVSLGFGYLGGNLAAGDNLNIDSPNQEVSQQIVLSESEVISRVAEQVGPSVVSITVDSQSRADNFFFGPQLRQQTSFGTGIILDESGLIVTNKHVIDEDTTGLTVVLADGREFSSIDILGRDPLNDIAFIKIKNAKNLTPAKLGDSDQVVVGEKVIAIGNALGEFNNTVTSGIISGVSRPVVAGDAFSGNFATIQNTFQTDAAINPGNSGGPLVNINGEVIGVNVAVADAENIGFSIPINDVKPGITSVNQNGELIRPYLGVRYTIINSSNAERLGVDAQNGALISGQPGLPAVLPGSPADKAGLQDEDIILSLGSTQINVENSLVTLIGQFQVGDTVELTIQRDGQQKVLEVVLEAAPDDL